MKCPASGSEYRAGDVVALACSVDFSGYMAPSLSWTDDDGRVFGDVYVRTTSPTVS